MPRLFIALRVPPNPVFERVLRQLTGLRGVAPVRPENLHYTLRFLGDVDGETKQRLMKILREAHMDERPFQIRVEGTGAFPNPEKPRVIWADCAPDDAQPLKRLADGVEAFTEELGMEQRDKPFVPHLTLARVKARGGRGVEAARAIIEVEQDTHYGTIDAKRLHLVESRLTPQGPRYHDLLEVPLR